MQPRGSSPSPQYRRSRLTPRGLAIRFALAGLVVVVIAAGIIYIATRPHKAENTEQHTEAKTGPREQLTAAKTLERAKKYFKGTESVKSSLSTPVKAEGSRFYSIATDPSKTKSAAATLPKAEAKRNVTALEHMLEYDQFTRYVVQDGDKDGSYLADFTRSNGDVTCQISNTPLDPNDPKNKETRFVEFKCLDAADYKDLAKQQAPLYNAYSPAASSSYNVGIVGTMTVRESKLAGYRLAEIPLGGVQPESHLFNSQGTALFYQSSDGRWVFFQIRQNDMLSCDVYKAQLRNAKKVDLRQIYEGDKCRDLSKGEVVTVEMPKYR